MDFMYLLSLFFVVSLVNASDYTPEGKLPNDFSFKKCKEDDEECKNKRESFMSQFKSYNLDNEDMIKIISNVELEIVKEVKDGNVTVHVYPRNKNA